MTIYLSPSALSAALNLRDLTDPTQGPHAMQTLLNAVVQRLSELWGVPAETRRDPALVAVADNYDNLGYESSAITRDQRYSRYVGPTVMLRSHTSAGVPPVLRSLAALAEDHHCWSCRVWSTGATLSTASTWERLTRSTCGGSARRRLVSAT